MKPGGITVVESGPALARRPLIETVRTRPRGFPAPDRWVAALLLLPVGIVILALVPFLLLLQGRPVFYASERVGRDGRIFRLFKLRTMSDGPEAERPLGGDQTGRVSRLGAILRRARLDELPQIINLIAGDIRLIGPRPPLPRYVAAYPEIYAEVLQSRPGITGLATVMLHRREERILSARSLPHDVDSAYRRHCIPQKARLDRLYRDRRSIGLDLFILARTIWRRPGAFRRLRKISLRQGRGLHLARDGSV